MFIAWGDEQTVLYNKALALLLGDRHPAALGRSLPEVWPDASVTFTELSERLKRIEAIGSGEFPYLLALLSFPVSIVMPTCTPIRDENQDIVGLCCSFDVTAASLLQIVTAS